MIWVVIADSNHCCIYSYQRTPALLNLVKEMVHPEIRQKTSEFLTSDKPGHYKAKDGAHGAFMPPTDPKEVAMNKFAKEISEFLDSSRKKQSYDKIIFIAAPRVNGLIYNQLNQNVTHLITNNINKDYMHMSDNELLAYLRENVLL